MLRILIVEDQVLIAHFLKETLKKEGFENIEMAYKINQATNLLHDFSPEVILLDINVEGKDTGIHWAENNLTSEKVIFITAQTELETMQKALKIKPISYLTKPVKKIELLAAIELARNGLKKNYVIVKDGYNELKVFFYEILFVKSDKNYIDIQTLTKKITLRNTLDNFLKELDTDIFHKVHRSYIVNKEKISKKTTTIIYINDQEIPISRGLEIKL